MLTCIFENKCIIAPFIRDNPFANTEGGRHDGRYGGGIYTENGFLSIGVERYSKECLLNGHPDLVLPDKKIEQTVIFGGYIFDHFGHFILESTARLWAKKFSPKNKFIFTSTKKALHSYQLEVLELFGDYEIVYRNSIFCNSLIIPSPSFIMGKPIQDMGANDYLREEFKRQVVNNCSKKYIYLSRANQSKRKCINEIDFESELIKLGVKIVYPENLSFLEQIELFSNTSLIIGMLGSAWHTLLFASPNSSCKRIYLDFLDIWKASYKFIEEKSIGKMYRIKCMEPADQSILNPYNAKYLLNIGLAVSEIKKIMAYSNQ